MAAMKKSNGCRVAKVRDGKFVHVIHVAEYREMELTSKELIVPSSTICVLTMALPRRAQKVAATRPAWMAVIAVRAVEPCSRKEPVERSWKGRVSR